VGGRAVAGGPLAYLAKVPELGAFSGKVDTGFPKENATKHRI
jgi:hypothetical protein